MSVSPPTELTAARVRAFRRCWGGTHLTAVLCFLAFVAVGNVVGGGLSMVYGAHPPHHYLRLLINLAVGVLLSGWALVRVRGQWREDASAPVPPPPEPDEERNADRAPGRWAKWWRVTRWVVIVVMLALAVVTIASEWGTLESALDRLGDLHWRMLRWAIYAEALSMIAFAQLTRLLLRAGGITFRMGPMIGLTLASNAVALTLPGGPAWAVTFSFDQLRRRGVRRSVSAYALTVTWVLSALALVVIALVGVDLAGSSGPVATFRLIANVATVLLGLAVIAGVLVLRLGRVRAGVQRRIDRVCQASRWRRFGELIGETVHDLRAVRLSPALIARCVATALLNWIYDCGCLVFAILAVGGHVPWQGVLAAYGLAQLAAALPITPGGIGVIEATLSVLLIAYHMPAATAIAGVMLYRIVGFWALLPIGWGAVGALVAMQRRGRARTAWVARRPPLQRTRMSAA